MNDITKKKMIIFAKKVKEARIKYDGMEEGFGEEIWLMAYELLEIEKVNTNTLSKLSETNTQTLNKWKRKMITIELDIGLEPELLSYLRAGRHMVPDARTQGFIVKAMIEDKVSPSDIAKGTTVSENIIGRWKKRFKNAYKAMMLLPPGMAVTVKSEIVFSTEDAYEVNELFKENKNTEDFIIQSKKNGFLKEKQIGPYAKKKTI